MKKLPYQSAYYSPSPKSGPEYYVYGETSDIEDFFDTNTVHNITLILVKYHKSIQDAESRCYSMACNDNLPVISVVDLINLKDKN